VRDSLVVAALRAAEALESEADDTSMVAPRPTAWRRVRDSNPR
jgi:hypothetical protein